MAFASINHTAAIWQTWGLKYIFRPPEQASQRQGWENAPRPAPMAQTPARRQWAAPEANGANSARGQEWRKPQQASPPARTPKIVAKFQPVPREQWPIIWQEQFARTRPGKIAWTYWRLAADLLGDRHPQYDAAGQSARRKLMGQLLSALGHPQGTHTFWPAQLNLKEEPGAEPEIFWSGLRTLGCRGLLIFGSEAAWPLLGARNVRPLQGCMHNGVFVHILNDMDKLMADAGQFRQTLAYLRSSLSIFMR